jgi:hypothetical protein
VSVVVCAPVWNPIATAQDDGGVRLVILPESIALTYNGPTSSDVFFPNEPVRVGLKLLNHTKSEFTWPARQPLHQLIALTLRPRGQQQPPDLVWSRIDLPRHVFDGTSPIPPENYAEMRWSVEAPVSGTLAPGIYNVTARLRLQGRRELAAEETLEVRVPSSRADQMDALLHAAIRARWDNNLQAARTALDSLLQLNPVSASAYAELGATYIAARDCAAARKSLDQAISIIEAGTDKENHDLGSRHYYGTGSAVSNRQVCHVSSR